MIDSNAALTSVIIGGSLIGGAQAPASSRPGALAVTIGGSVREQRQGPADLRKWHRGGEITGDLLGGGGVGAGAIFTSSQLAGVTIGGSVIGGSGPHQRADSRRAGHRPITIGGDLRGEGAAPATSAADAGAVTIGVRSSAARKQQRSIVRIFDTGNVGPSW